MRKAKRDAIWALSKAILQLLAFVLFLVAVIFFGSTRLYSSDGEIGFCNLHLDAQALEARAALEGEMEISAISPQTHQCTYAFHISKVLINDYTETPAIIAFEDARKVHEALDCRIRPGKYILLVKQDGLKSTTYDCRKLAMIPVKSADEFLSLHSAQFRQ